MAADEGAGEILLKGARQHNLKNIDVRLPRHRLVVITGPSGSGKSSLAFDTLYAEGQRRYLESLSAFARQFLEQIPKPDVDRVEGLSPALAIEQKGLGHNPRSTVGTVTEILPFLRLLFARVGRIASAEGSTTMLSATPERILADIDAAPEGAHVTILAPLLRARRGEHRKTLKDLRKRGFARVRVDGEIQRLDELEQLEKGKRHDLDVVVDRLVAGRGKTARVRASVETALELGRGQFVLHVGGEPERTYSRRLQASGEEGPTLERLEPRLFSFNTPAGACKRCQGLGRSRNVTAQRIVPDPESSIADGALAPLRGRSPSFVNEQVDYLVQELGGSLSTPWRDLDSRIQRALIDGTSGEEFAELRDEAEGHRRFLADFEGFRSLIERRYHSTRSARIRAWCEDFMEEVRCPACEGSRLSVLARSVTVHGIDLGSLCAQPAERLDRTLDGWEFRGSAAVVAAPLLAEIRQRVRFLVEAGLGYLSVDRGVDSLSGGEGQRVRLATQVAGQLTGALYVLDEPSIGLHARDTEKLVDLLHRLRDRGNTVVVVEHDREIIEAADHLVDIGPGAGEHGGRVVGEGPPDVLRDNAESPTGRWLARPVSRSDHPEAPEPEHWLRVRGARSRNLKGVDVEIPLGRLVAVTGVSGSGKSTAIHDVLYRALARQLHRATARPGDHDTVEGVEHLKKVVLIDQGGIGRSPRSTPATFTGLYTHLRKLMSQTPQARTRGFGPGRFSFNTKGGRCETCAGAGVRALSMDFLPEVSVECDVCRGQRFNRQTLEITWKGHTIADLLDLDVERARRLLGSVPPIERVLETLDAVGLGYLRLGQRADTLSGGEAQRLKLARELSRPSQGDTLYLLDEPTTGLHYQDVEMLLGVLRALVERGNTVVVIEHQPDVILAADHIIDLGPEGGEEGGNIVVAGPVEAVLQCAGSYTGAMLRRMLDA